jgi:glycosyltransferase involved in cell wall biosynthesis
VRRALLISVVMPSYNQAQYLAAAIESVLSYDGASELIVMDGGSSDGSVDVLEHYSARLTHWQSAPDGGQAAAINAGFAKASGDILCWLNSDDLHLPGTLARVVAAAGEAPRRFFRYGSAVHLRESPQVEVVLAPAYPAADGRLLHDAVVVQPSAFWSRDVWENTGPLDEGLHFAFDWEWFIRAQRHAEFTHVDEVYSVYRLHEAHKTGSGGSARRQEICEVVRRHAPDDWVSRYEQLLHHVEAGLPQIEALQRRGLPFHRAAMLITARRGHLPRTPAEARRWSFVMRMYA